MALSNRQAVEREIELLSEYVARNPWRPLDGPQRVAFDSKADIIGYGGAAGGGKTDLGIGLALCKHRRVLCIRREKAQTESVVQRLIEVVGHTGGLNSMKGVWRLPIGRKPLFEFGGLDNLGDESRWQGRAHDLKWVDEAGECRESQVRFIIGWTRSAQTDVHPQVLLTFNPPTKAEGRWIIEFFAPWLDGAHPNPAIPGELRWFTSIDGKDTEVADDRRFALKNGIIIYDFDEKNYAAEDVRTPKSRTFIPARVTDNRYLMTTGYMAQLQALPEPLRSQMLNGDFMAGVEDDPWQVIPTPWIEAAQARWVRPIRLAPMDSVGIDVARGGKDQTVIARRHDYWYDELLTYAGSQTPDGPTVAGLTIAAARDNAPQHIDIIGVGSSPYDFLKRANQHVIGVNVSVSAHGTDRSGRLTFRNLRSELWWRMREDLDPNNNTGIALPPDKALLADLSAPKWSASGGIIYVESREDIVKRIGRSPDRASAVILARLETPKYAAIGLGSQGQAKRDYDPFDALR